MNNLHGFWQSPENRQELALLLQNETITLVATDTIYGLLSCISPKTYEALSAIKSQRNNKPYLILISNLDKISYFIDNKALAPKVKKFIERCWPGPVTIIFKARKELPSYMMSNQQTIALRCPDHKGLRAILKKFDGLFSTSANKSNQPSPQKFSDISPEILDHVSYIMSDDTTIKKNLSSTIIDCTNPSTITLVREGAYSLSTLEEYYGQAFEKQ